MRFLVSSVGSVTPSASALGADVLNCFITGQEAYAKKSGVLKPMVIDSETLRGDEGQAELFVLAA